MKKDPIVEEIRNIRQAHAAKFQYDLKTICADLKEKEKDCGHAMLLFQALCRYRHKGQSFTIRDGGRAQIFNL